MDLAKYITEKYGEMFVIYDEKLGHKISHLPKYAVRVRDSSENVNIATKLNSSASLAQVLLSEKIARKYGLNFFYERGVFEVSRVFRNISDVDSFAEAVIEYDRIVLSDEFTSLQNMQPESNGPAGILKQVRSIEEMIDSMIK